jgi:ferredoxin
MLKINLQLDNKHYCIYTQSNKYLLDAIEDNNIPAAHNCRQGNCGQCLLKLHNGQVIWDKKPLMQLEKNEILTCCCRGATDLTLSD